MVGFKEFAFKRMGFFTLGEILDEQKDHRELSSYTRIVFAESGGKIVIDFSEFNLTKDAFLFIKPGQQYFLDDNCKGIVLYYNRDFYCVEIHDKEVACDGILFNNVFEVPIVYMDNDNSYHLQTILHQIVEEMNMDDTGTEEMLRILLKQLIIKCTRLWKQQHALMGKEAKPEVEFLRTFSKMVESNYKSHHTVAAYAMLFHITPKALNKRITRCSNNTPNDIIKDRIILEAKRLLAHTPLSVKEIGYKLGYDDPSYFIRFFTKYANLSPQSFRKQYHKP